jgi:hypothetical protein
MWTLAAIPLAAQNQSFGNGNLSFSLSPKVLKDGSILDAALGWHYTANRAGTLRLRFSTTAKNEQFDETVPDSLVAIEDSRFETFLTPFEYALLNKPSVQIKVGAGVYYNYYTLTEKGFFDMPILDQLALPRVNSFANEATMHLVGPHAALGMSVQSEWFSMTINAGVVPYFYLNAEQRMSIIPLMEPGWASNTQDTAGSPYLYADLAVTLFKYVSIAVLYDYTKLAYRVVDFDFYDDEFKWLTPEREVVSHSLKVEACALLPLGGDVYAQLGYGYTFDYTQTDSAPALETNRQYAILTLKTMR